MKKLLFFLALVPMVFMSCSKDEDSEKASGYQVVLHNSVTKDEILDGNLYDVYLVSRTGDMYAVGDISLGGSKTYYLPSDYNVNFPLFPIVRFGKDRNSAYRNPYMIPVKGTNTQIADFSINKNGKTDYYFQDFVNDEYMSTQITDINSFKEYIRTIMNQ